MTSLAITPGHAQEPGAMFDGAIGPGFQHLPAWPGAADHRDSFVPYLSLSWADRAELSTTDGLNVDLIHREQWHGGLLGDYRWGRSRGDLGALADSINTLPPTLSGGFYLEYAVTPSLDVDVRLLRDIAQPGRQAEARLSWDLPRPEWLDHSLQVKAIVADAALQDRYFGVAPQWAERLHVAPYRANGGWQQVAVAYDAFLPTSIHTGFALNLEYARYLGAAAASPLLRDFGSRGQFSVGIAFVYHMNAPVLLPPP